MVLDTQNVSTTREKFKDEFCYFLFGTNIKMPFERPALRGVGGKNFDVNVCYGTVPQSLKNPQKVGACFQAAPNEFLLKVPNIASYLVKDGAEIIIERERRANDDDVFVFLANTAFAALMLQRKKLVILASVIEHEGKAVAFAGASGRGKSSLALGLLERGAKLMSDELCVISTKSGYPHVEPAGPEIKIWKDAAVKHGICHDKLKRVRPNLEKYVVDASDKFCARSLPLKRIYFFGYTRVWEFRARDTFV